MSFIITSYFTYGTPYAEVAHKFLMPSVLDIKVKSDIRGVSNLGSWQKNTSYKPRFIREALDRQTENIVFVDCDAQILKYPDIFENIPEQYNIAAHVLDRKLWYNNGADGKELLSGTMFIRNTKHTKAIVEVWAKRCEISINWEQTVLQTLLDEMKIEVYCLPVGYCYIATMPDGSEPHVKCDDIIIKHHQMSRKLRHMIT